MFFSVFEVLIISFLPFKPEPEEMAIRFGVSGVACKIKPAGPTVVDFSGLLVVDSFYC